MQINLTGFLNGKYARSGHLQRLQISLKISSSPCSSLHPSPRVFMGELWTMLDSAQNSPNGIPKDLVSQKMAEIGARKVTHSS